MARPAARLLAIGVEGELCSVQSWLLHRRRAPGLANIALHMLDEAWAGGGLRLGELVKYADDLVVLSATREPAEEARELVAAVLDGLGLRLHPGKTRIAHLTRGAEGFTFLGFEHRMRVSWRQPGRWYLHKWPSRRAMASIRGKIRARADRCYAGLPLEWAFEDLNRMLRGWCNYFATGTPGGSSPTSTAMSTNASRSSRASSTDS